MEVRAEVCKAGVKACAALVGQALLAEAKALLNARRPAGLLSEMHLAVERLVYLYNLTLGLECVRAFDIA
jgi:hypothetical protein